MGVWSGLADLGYGGNQQQFTFTPATGNLIVNPTSVAELDRVYHDEIARYQAIARSINFEPQ